MRERLVAASLLLALISGCAGSNAAAPVPLSAQAAGARALPQAVHPDAGSNLISNPGFETGALSPWTSCGSVSEAAVSTVQAHSGTYSALIGKTSKPEVNGTAALCQTVAVPASATLTFWVYEGTNDTIKYVNQEAAVYDTSGDLLATLYSEAKSTGGWVEKTFSLSSYAGETVQLYFGVTGNGYASDYVYEYLDDISVTSGTSTAPPTPTPLPTTAPTATPAPTSAPTAGATATPKATATPVATATPKATATPVSTPVPTPTPVPTAAPTTAAFTCNNQGFLNDQSEFAAGSITADQFVDICGAVTQVLPEKDTSSGHHGYFYVEMPSGYQIEIVSNLDAMAEASTDQPPSTWPWVAVNQYVYVQGRYYYDSSSSQGVDWTEDDTSSSWEHLGYVAVCTSTGASCQKYW